MPIPKVFVGDPVYWYPDGDPNQKPHAATVTSVGEHSLCVNIQSPDNQNMRIRDGVMHISDPRCRNEYNRDSGGWDESVLLKRLRVLELATLQPEKGVRP